MCGRLSLQFGGVERAAALRGRQVPLLLAYLVLSRDRPVGREELSGALWPHQAPRSQDAALRTLLSRLRSALGRTVLAGRDELNLELPDPVWVDVEAASTQLGRAQEALSRGDARQAWAAAQVPLNIASRGLLPGAQATWLDRRRAELEDMRLAALEVIGRAGLELGSGQLGSVERAARSLIEAEPYRESGYVLLMAALSRQGNIAEALRVFERLRALLRDELGIAPSPDTLTAHERLLRPGEPAPAPVHPAGGPSPLPLPAALRARAAPAMVGREAEIAELDRWLGVEDGASGPAAARPERLLVLAGEAGIGKTRLLAEAAARMHAAGGTVLAGRAAEEYLAPFEPFLQALGHWASSAPLEDLRELALHHGAELSRLIPELRRRLPELPAVTDGDSETERYRLFEAVVELLRDLSARAPVLVVIDDLHWADRPTLMLLRHLARAAQTQRVSLLAAYRTRERSTEGFQAVLATLRGDRLLRQIDVAGLARPQAHRLVEARVGGPPSRELIAALYAETEGNPFFIEEMVRHLIERGVNARTAGAHELAQIGLPEDVRELISRRLGRLSADGLETLRVAAVIGREFDSALLERVLGLDETRFLEALEEGLAAGLVNEAPGAPERYAFAHALIRETLYGAMSTARRARLHRRVGLTLEAKPSAARTEELAHHFTRAGSAEDADRAIRYAVDAGEHAAAMLAHDQTAAFYESALAVQERFRPEARDERLGLLLELGEARIRSGERPLAWAVFRRAATLAAELGDADSLARSAIGASRRFVQPPGVIDAELISLLEQALALYPVEPSVTRVMLLCCLCSALYFSQRRAEMRRLSAEATVAAAALGSTRAVALAAGARRRAYWGPGHLERRLADSTQLLRAAREAGDRELTMQGHAWLVVDLLETGDRAAVEAQIAAFESGARDLRQPLFAWQAAVWRAMHALMAGKLDAAEELAGEALSAGIRPESVTAPHYFAVQLVAIRREQRRMAELEPVVRSLVEGNPERPAWRAALALLLAETDRPDDAQLELDRLAAARFADIPHDGDWLTTTTLLADAIFATGDAQRAALLYELLYPYRAANVVIGLAAVCLGATARYLGRLALTSGDVARARSHLEAAVRSNEALGAPVELAHAQLDLALAVGRGFRARELVASAGMAASELGLPLLAARAAAAEAG